MEYPRVLYHPQQGEVLARSAEHHAELGAEWFLFPNFTNGPQVVIQREEEPATPFDAPPVFVQAEEVPVEACWCGSTLGHRGRHRRQ
jgi:hypothetical protein